ncbi:hypothetical protein TSAR_015793 [Trichomalopsis sarcophagae]|uniref:Sulfotransferase domain-containing protein n=1 Tax=Trichomalopsis sarcophagae TaxID=543379 RepID=A0A232FEI3_9HYME|nr:hypothetical protein TSAR_015793 [Trichomalopsis sarcophagae]
MDSELDQILSECLSEDVPIQCINYKGLFVPDTYPVIADSVENFEVRDDDIWVCSFPKTGTTTTGWVSIRNPMDRQFPDIFAKSVENAASLPSPRFLKTHMPYHLLPRQLRTRDKQCKIIYITRNPKDTCVSYYHHYKMLEAYCSTFENFCKLFLGDKVYYAPFWDHVIGFWSRKEDKNILLLKYEDMKADLPSVIRKTANFLGKNLSDEKVKTLEEHLSFHKMKDNPSVNLGLAVHTINTKKIFGQNFIAEVTDRHVDKAETRIESAIIEFPCTPIPKALVIAPSDGGTVETECGLLQLIAAKTRTTRGREDHYTPQPSPRLSCASYRAGVLHCTHNATSPFSLSIYSAAPVKFFKKSIRQGNKRKSREMLVNGR